MQDRISNVERLLVEIAHLHENGEYRQAYHRAIDALSLVTEFSPGKELCVAVLVSAARSAYYLSNFNDCLEFIQVAVQFCLLLFRGSIDT